MVALDEQADAWKKVTEAVHNKDGTIFMQLWHMGRACHSSYFDLQPVAASAIAIQGPGFTARPKSGERDVPYEVPRALATEEIATVVEEFRSAAQRAKSAGFDGTVSKNDILSRSYYKTGLKAMKIYVI